jgi:hypothetical protein
MSEVRVEARAPSFFDLYSRSEVVPDDIHDFIGRWHDDQEPWARDIPLHEYLGLTHDEYGVWLCDPFSLPCILQARQPGGNLADIMAARYAQLRAADRGEDGTIIFSLGNWLTRQPRP